MKNTVRWPGGKFYAFLILIFLLPTMVCGQGELRYKPDALRLVDGVLHTYSAPARWNGKDWLILGGLVAGTTALTFIDQPVRNFWQSHDNQFMDGVERVGYHYGKPYTALAVTGGFYLSGMIFKSAWAKETGLILGTSIFSSSMIMGVLKNAAGRRRPAAGVDHMDFKPFDQSPAYHAFPSGHTSVAFGISLVLARRVESVPLKIFFYSLAGSTVVSRMYSDNHWASDIAFGGMLAWFCADAAISRMQVNRFRSARLKKDILVWKVLPYPGGFTLTAIVR
jgi:membrane-associated phospholipid phosphatase